MNSKEFRAELVKIMPGYDWTVHKSHIEWRLEATGTQSSGFNRLSTLSIVRVEIEGQKPSYEVKSAGFGLKAMWLHTNKDGTLARALRGLQDYYEATARTHRSHAEALKQGRHNGDSPMKRIYVSGPMTGLPDLNFPAFHAEAARLKVLGYDVVNPADLNPDPGMGWHECMRRDLAALLTCDALALLSGWQKSAGAHLEMHVAHRVGIEILDAGSIQQPQSGPPERLCSFNQPRKKEDSHEQAAQ